ncbi:MAG TPA: hypothetical protein VGX23_12995 [Actinocrinis sp.]|nr:hypothetical protein [Actinocrinis sp.]
MREDRRGGDAATAVRVARAGFSALADLALPGECAGCGGRAGGRGGPDRRRPDRREPGCGPGVCAACAAALDRVPVRVHPARGRAGLAAVYALAAYREPLSDLIVAQKERGRLDLAGPLGRMLGTVVRAALAECPPGGGDESGLSYISGAADRPQAWAGWRILLVPIPSNRAAERRRGHRPVLRMARVAAADLRREGFPVRVLRALRHGRPVADQVGLSQAARAANLAGAMRVTPAGVRALSGGRCVVVLADDVCTSGATLSEAARALGAAAGPGSGRRLLAAVLAGPVR